MTLTNIDRCRLEHAAQLLAEVREMLDHDPVDLELGAEKLRSAFEKIRATLAPEIGDEPVTPDAPLAVVTLCRFCGGTGIRPDGSIIDVCPACNATGLQSGDARNAGAIAIANNLRAILAAFEPFRVTLAPEIGDTRVIRSHEFTEAHPCFRCGGTGIIPNPPGVCSVFPMECPDCQQRRHAAEMLQTTLTAEQDPFRVLGSCPAPAPQVDVIDGETA